MRFILIILACFLVCSSASPVKNEPAVSLTATTNGVASDKIPLEIKPGKLGIKVSPEKVGVKLAEATSTTEVDTTEQSTTMELPFTTETISKTNVPFTEILTESKNIKEVAEKSAKSKNANNKKEQVSEEKSVGSKNAEVKLTSSSVEEKKSVAKVAKESEEIKPTDEKEKVGESKPTTTKKPLHSRGKARFRFGSQYGRTSTITSTPSTTSIIAASTTTSAILPASSTSSTSTTQKSIAKSTEIGEEKMTKEPVQKTEKAAEKTHEQKSKKFTGKSVSEKSFLAEKQSGKSFVEGKGKTTTSTTSTAPSFSSTPTTTTSSAPIFTSTTQKPIAKSTIKANENTIEEPEKSNGKSLAEEKTTAEPKAKEKTTKEPGKEEETAAEEEDEKSIEESSKESEKTVKVRSHISDEEEREQKLVEKSDEESIEKLSSEEASKPVEKESKVMAKGRTNIPTPEERRKDKKYHDIQIVKLESELAENGKYSFNFESDDGTLVEQEGELKKMIMKNGEAKEKEEVQMGESVRGSYSYKDDDGQTYKVEYTADEYGYRPVGAHIPTIPPEIARALAWSATAKPWVDPWLVEQKKLKAARAKKLKAQKKPEGEQEEDNIEDKDQ